jgi:hypothetical protein
VGCMGLAASPGAQKGCRLLTPAAGLHGPQGGPGRVLLAQDHYTNPALPLLAWPGGWAPEVALPFWGVPMAQETNMQTSALGRE